MKTQRVAKIGLIASVLVILPAPAPGAEAGHYLPGVVNIRDWAVPEKGWYFTQYNTWYRSTDLKDANQSSVGSVAIAGRPIRPDVSTGMFAPTFLWSMGSDVFGGDFAMLISPTFGKTALANHLYALNARQDLGGEHWGLGDMFVQPVRLSWHNDIDSFTLAYGFYAPVGNYTAGSRGNVGLGFWSNQFSGTVYHYLQPNHSTALMITALYELNTAKLGTTNTPGGHIGLEYGFSQYLGKRWEIGAGGFSYYQVSDDRGADAASPKVYDRVHGVGPQGTFWIVPSRLSLAFRMLWEYGAKARFEGSNANLTLTYVFRTPK